MMLFLNTLKLLGANALSMLVTKTFFMWLLRLVVKKSDNLIDDNVVLLVDALYERDINKAKEAIEVLYQEITKLYKESNKNG